MWLQVYDILLFIKKVCGMRKSLTWVIFTNLSHDGWAVVFCFFGKIIPWSSKNRGRDGFMKIWKHWNTILKRANTYSALHILMAPILLETSLHTSLCLNLLRNRRRSRGIYKLFIFTGSLLWLRIQINYMVWGKNYISVDTHHQLKFFQPNNCMITVWPNFALKMRN